jgi:hypothetical protein
MLYIATQLVKSKGFYLTNVMHLVPKHVKEIFKKNSFKSPLSCQKKMIAWSCSSQI